MVTNISHNPTETETLAEEWGRTIERGRVIALCGDLGAGKTQLVKGLARGLEISARVHSPTFTLVNCYLGGRLSLFHLDLYRLETPELVRTAGLEEYLSPDGVTVIEWAERWFGKKPVAASIGKGQISDPLTNKPASRNALLRWVEIEVIGESERRICYEDIGL
jgi:tRNA threonylcarbamoyladenosine biosynthesis protein TsaE